MYILKIDKSEIFLVDLELLLLLKLFFVIKEIFLFNCYCYRFLLDIDIWNLNVVMNDLLCENLLFMFKCWFIWEFD